MFFNFLKAKFKSLFYEKFFVNFKWFTLNNFQLKNYLGLGEFMVHDAGDHLQMDALKRLSARMDMAAVGWPRWSGFIEENCASKMS